MKDHIGKIHDGHAIRFVQMLDEDPTRANEKDKEREGEREEACI